MGVGRAVSGAFVLALIFSLPSAGAWGRDISLGGQRDEQRHSQSDTQFKAQLPKDAVALPRVVTSVLNQETGRWQRVLVDAYLQSPDRHSLSQVESKLQDIAQRLGPQLQARPAEYLEAAHSGTREVKDCIRLATEQSLGHPWDGNIYIRSMAVF